MGKEIEYKLRAENEAQLNEIYHRLKQEIPSAEDRIFYMHTRYFDTPERILSEHMCTLRIRQENDRQVLTCKTGGTNHCRGEWNLPRTADASLPLSQELTALVALGAPGELTQLNDLCVCCEARFIRRCTMLTLHDGTSIEMAADVGELCGRTERETFYELELELYGGSEASLSAFAKQVELPEEHRSKAARAFALA